jgi:hypothetical protein
MADTAYALYMSAAFEGTYDLATAVVKLVLVNIAGGHYSPNFVTDQYLSAVASGDRISISAQLTSVTITQGSGPISTFSAANTVFSSATGAAAGALLIFIDTGTPTTSPLIAYIDSYSGLPVTPTGSDINVAFNGSGIIVQNG